MSSTSVYIGCAGWNIGREYGSEFAGEGTHLERYAEKFNAVEINSSFYRAHRPATYKKWAASVGGNFRFSVKTPKSITHENRLQDCGMLLDTFLSECCALGDHLGCLLVQLPPSLAFDPRIASRFFEDLRARYPGHVVIEPRHESWVSAQALFVEHRIAQAAVDPRRLSNDALPSGWQGFRYWRLHGSPTIYHSEYEESWLRDRALEMQPFENDALPTWCIFDNTARGAAIGNALTLRKLLGPWAA